MAGMNSILKENWETILQKIIQPMYEDGEFPLTLADEVLRILEQQLTGGWISVSERLPSMEECQKNDCRFIVTDGNRRYQAWFDYDGGYFDKCKCDGLGLKKDNCVVAWQPMPEPCEGFS